MKIEILQDIAKIICGIVFGYLFSYIYMIRINRKLIDNFLWDIREVQEPIRTELIDKYSEKLK